MNGMQAIEASSIARWMREALWAYPAVEATHILALGLVVGSIVIVDLRLLGLSRDVPVARLSRHALPWTVGAFVVAIKMGLLLLAGINAGILHTGPWRSIAQWDTGAMPPGRVRFSAAVSIVIWISVVACGRLLAYT